MKVLVRYLCRPECGWGAFYHVTNGHEGETDQLDVPQIKCLWLGVTTSPNRFNTQPTLTQLSILRKWRMVLSFKSLKGTPNHLFTAKRKPTVVCKMLWGILKRKIQLQGNKQKIGGQYIYVTENVYTVLIEFLSI